MAGRSWSPPPRWAALSLSYGFPASVLEGKHSFLVFGPEAGASAIGEIARVVTTLHEAVHFEAGTTINVGVLHGGRTGAHEHVSIAGMLERTALAAGVRATFAVTDRPT